jgi:hypothetical protein
MTGWIFLSFCAVNSRNDRVRALPAFQFFADKFADAPRLIGAGNATAFLAAIVAFTYFPQKPEMTDFLPTP